MNNRIVLFLLVVAVMFSSSFVKTSAGYSIFIDSSNNNHATGIPAWLQSWGNSVTVVSDYKGENLSSYDIVMDFDNDAWHALTLQEKSALRHS